MSLVELRVISIVYLSALIPLLILYKLYRSKKLKQSNINIYIFSFILCALSWEIWFTYGLVDGDPVDLRRSDILNLYIPKHLNWVLNSMADAGTITLGGLFLSYKITGIKLYNWSWLYFSIFFLWCITQNLFVEVFLYFDQLSIDKKLSWAPFAPTGPWINPLLFEINGRTIHLQSQLPWVITAPILIQVSIYFNRKENSSYN